MRYCESPYALHRRATREVIVGDPARGGVIIGGDHPVVRQSMLTCDTMDTAACVRQTLDLVAVGCQLVRITAGLCYVVVALAVLGIGDVMMQTPDSVGGTSAILTRVGGILMAIAMIRVCLEAERTVIDAV